MADRAHVQSTYLRDLAGWAHRQGVAPAAVVAGLAHAAARAEGWPDAGHAAAEGLSPGAGGVAVPPPPPELDLEPGLLGSAYEAVLDADDRRARGAYFTPPLVARRLVDLVLDGPHGRGLHGVRGALSADAAAGACRAAAVGPVVDPAVGGGAFLLAAAARLVGSPPDPTATGRPTPASIVIDRLYGADIDPVAVSVTRLGLAWWAWRAAGRDPAAWPVEAGRHVVVGDALLDDGCWPEVDPDRPGVVVGNPPFLGQLNRRTARTPAVTARLVQRFGSAARGYVDGAALFLLAACYRRPPGCRVALILPEPVLVTAHAAGVRREVLAAGRLVGVWLGGPDVFGAGVRVCAPVVELGDPPGGEGPGRSCGTVRAWEGPRVEPCGDLPTDTAALRRAPTWAALTARRRGVPSVPLRSGPRGTSRAGGGRLGDVARATAGFRDQFYGLAPFVEDGPSCVGAGAAARWAALVTTGLIDPARCDWGRVDARFAGRRLRHPVVDLDALAGADERLAAWVAARLRPKVLVATQTKVLEAVADPDGRLVPSVPVIAVEPADPSVLWRILAVLCSPVATAWALAHYGGAGLSEQSVKLSARQVLTLPTPADDEHWDAAAADCRAASEAVPHGSCEAGTQGTAEGTAGRRELLRRAAVRSCAAYGIASGQVNDLVGWWEQRVRWEDPEILRRSP